MTRKGGEILNQPGLRGKEGVSRQIKGKKQASSIYPHGTTVIIRIAAYMHMVAPH